MPAATFFSLPRWLSVVVADPFKRYLFLALALTGLFMTLRPAPEIGRSGEADIRFFFHPACSSCQKQKPFNRSLQARHPDLSFAAFDISLPENGRLLTETLTAKGIQLENVPVPVTMVGPHIIWGFHSRETTGVRIEQAIDAYRRNDPAIFTGQGDPAAARKVRLPLLGEVRVEDYSLPALAVVIGLADGFNPCAMWVLVYLIGTIATLNDRAKVWLLVGSFVLASGILYFLFMTAWLNTFLFIGFLRPLTIVIGLFALGAGILSLREVIVTRGAVVCAVSDAKEKERTMGRVKAIVLAPLSLASVAGVITLAFVVNSIEFACSAALPAIFTHTLSLRALSPWQYYGYILLYDFFFMLDDLIIFSLAALALDRTVGTRYVAHCRVIAGVLLTALGFLMVFMPETLR